MEQALWPARNRLMSLLCGGNCPHRKRCHSLFGALLPLSACIHLCLRCHSLFDVDVPLHRQAHGVRRRDELHDVRRREVRSIPVVSDGVRGLRGGQAPGVHGQRRRKRLRGVRCRCGRLPRTPAAAMCVSPARYNLRISIARFLIDAHSSYMLWNFS